LAPWAQSNWANVVALWARCLAGLAVAVVCRAPARQVNVSLDRASPRPNIVLYLSDDHGVDFVGCYGNPVVRTPNIDGLAREGTRFNNVFAASPTCSPSRSAMFTGLWPQRNGTMGNHTDCRPGTQSLPDYLRPLGYRVVAVNKTDVRPRSVFSWEHVPARLPTDPAFRRYRDEGLDTAKVDQFLAQHVREHPGQPLCLLIGDNGPHVVWETNRIYDLAALPMTPLLVDTPKTRLALANYYQDITTTDGRVGQVLDSLKRHGLATNLLFIYTTDQGAEWPRCKWTLYDSGLRVPFIARWPGVLKPGTESSALISLVDLTPTFVEVAGGNPAEGLDGQSFKEVLLGKQSAFREELFASHSGDGTMNLFPQRAMRDTRFKYILNLHPERDWTTHFTKVAGIPNSHAEVWNTWLEKAKTDAAAAHLVNLIVHHPKEELYDTQADRYELTNLVDHAEMKPVLEQMRKGLAQWRREVSDQNE
jgi:N-sulfoglucosamine sulfohydrolase